MAGDSLQKDLAEVLNFYSAENGSNTPDFILATYLLACLKAFEEASRTREIWYGKALRVGGVLDLSVVTGGAVLAVRQTAGEGKTADARLTPLGEGEAIGSAKKDLPVVSSPGDPS